MLDKLYDMEAEIGLDNITYLAGLEGIGRFFKCRDKCSFGLYAQIAPFSPGRTGRMLLCKVVKISAIL